MPVKNEILVNVTPEETRVALIEEGVLQELHLRRNSSDNFVGNIYKGKVTRVLPGMQAAFVDIGFDKNGFLHVRDVCKKEENSKNQNSTNSPKIESLLREGEMVMVQVSKPAKGEKGANLTMKISVPSRHLIFLPFSNGIGISNKIDDEHVRARLRNSLESLSAEKDLAGRIIVRTQAESANDLELEADIFYLKQRWEKISSANNATVKVSPIFKDTPLAQSAIRDFANSETLKILIDSSDAYSQVKKFVAEFMPEVDTKIDLYADENPLFSQYDIEQQINQALERKLDLASGGSLFIDQTEAMTTIDVNTGSDVKGGLDQATFLRTNLEATDEIVRQIRLRNLSGIIIIDFIDMTSLKYKKQVLLALQSAIAKDRVKIQVSDMSSLGLVEITRRCSSASLDELLCEPCKVCDGRGLVKSADTLCFDILRDIKRENSELKVKTYTVVACPEVVDVLQNNQANSLAYLEKLIQCSINLQVDLSYSQQQYDIVLN